MAKTMTTTKTKTRKKCLLLNNHKRTQIQRQWQRQGQKQRQRQRHRKSACNTRHCHPLFSTWWPLGHNSNVLSISNFELWHPPASYWPFVKHLWKSKSQTSSHIDHLMIVIKVFKRETDHLLLMKTIIRESVKILSALPLEASRSYQSIGLARRTSPITSDPFLRYRLFYH